MKKKTRLPDKSHPVEARASSTRNDAQPTVENNSIEDNSSSTKFGFDWKWVDWSVRLGLVLFMVFMFVGTVAKLLFPGLFVVEMDTSTLEPVQLQSHQVDEISASTPELFLGDFLDGDWILGQSKWQFSSQELATPPSEAEFAERPARLRMPDPEFDDSTFVDIFKSYSATEKTVGDLTYWRMTAMGIEAAMYTSQSSEGPVVQVLRASFPSENGISFVSGIPSRFAFEDKSPETLLPTGEGVQQLAIRTNEDGVVSSAILELSIDSQVLINRWRAEGWEVFPNYRIDAINDQYQCRRGAVILTVTFLNNGEQTTAIVVRVPAADL